MESPAPALDRIAAARLLPVVRTPDADEATQVVLGLIAAGLGVVELTTSIPQWPGVLDRVRRAEPETCIGVGTLLDAADAHRAVDAGAGFLVTPRLDPAVRSVAHAGGVPIFEGGTTPTEILAAVEANGIAKLFPAHLGGPAYLQSLLSVVPGARIVPTGGIRLVDIPRWLDAGAFAVGVGRDLLDGDIAATLRALDLGRLARR